MVLPTKVLLALLPFFLQANAQASGSGTTTRYWDCCKASCGWPGKLTLASGSNPVTSCDASDNPITNYNAVSGCDSGGSTYMCSTQQPWAVSDTLAYGFAATTISGGTEASWCCACYELTFTSTAVAGKTMIVQATNTGGDLGANQFDLAVRYPNSEFSAVTDVYRCRAVDSESSTAARQSGEHPAPAGAPNTAAYRHALSATRFLHISSLAATGASTGSRTLTTPPSHSSKSSVQLHSPRSQAVSEQTIPSMSLLLVRPLWRHILAVLRLRARRPRLRGVEARRRLRRVGVAVRERLRSGDSAVGRLTPGRRLVLRVLLALIRVRTTRSVCKVRKGVRETLARCLLKSLCIVGGRISG